PLWNLIQLVELVEIAQLAIHLFVSITTRMNGMDLANRARPDPLADLANGTAGVPLIAELSYDFVAPRRRHQFAHFVDGMSQRLFAIDMLAMLHRLHRDDGVRVIGSADDYAVNFFAHLLEHHAKIFKLFGL